MSIASQMKLALEQGRMTYIEIIEEAELKSKNDIDQDWDLETTTYNFADGSKLVDNNGNLTDYEM